MTLVPVGATSTRPLKWVFVFLLVFSTITTLFITFPSNAGLEKVNLMYFYEYEPIPKEKHLFTLRERWKCRDSLPFPVILVSSRPKEAKARQAIRIMWGSGSSWWGQRVLTLFLLGQDTQGGDNTAELLVEDKSLLYREASRRIAGTPTTNLTLQTILGFCWVAEFCPSTRFLVKTDSDVFINAPNLVEFLQQPNSPENLFTGYPLSNNSAHRACDKTTSISYQECPFRSYHPQCGGMGMSCVENWP